MKDSWKGTGEESVLKSPTLVPVHCSQTVQDLILLTCTKEQNIITHYHFSSK